MKNSGFFQTIQKCKKSVLKIRIKLASERLVSLFSKHYFDCIGFLYIEPISNKKMIRVVNAFDLLLPSFSNISVQMFLKSKLLEEAELYEITHDESKKILEKILEIKEFTPDLWIQRFHKACSSHTFFQRTLCFFIDKLLYERKSYHTWKNKQITKMTAHDLEQTTDGFHKDLEFLANVWPYLLEQLMKNEFRFTLPMSSQDSLPHFLKKGISEGVISYDTLCEENRFVPKIQANQPIVLSVEPCKPLKEICGDFRTFLETIEYAKNTGKPVEIHYERLIHMCNDLFQSCGEQLLEFPPHRENVSAVLCASHENERSEHLIFDSDVSKMGEMDKMGEMGEMNDNKEKQKKIRIYNYQDRIDIDQNVKDAVLEEILFFVDGIAKPEQSYDFLRTCLMERLKISKI